MVPLELVIEERRKVGVVEMDLKLELELELKLELDNRLTAVS
jgi:hypothetical protein